MTITMNWKDSDVKSTPHDTQHVKATLSRYFRSRLPLWLPLSIMGVLGSVSASIAQFSIESDSYAAAGIFGLFTIFWSGGAIYWGMKSPRPTVSDAEADRLITADLRWFTSGNHAVVLEKLGLVDEQLQQEPLCAYGPVLQPSECLTPKAKLGADGIYRFSSHEFLTLYLTEHHLNVYTCTFDSVARRVVVEGTREYSYNDLVSVQSETKLEAIKQEREEPFWPRLIPFYSELRELFRVPDPTASEKEAIPLQTASVTFTNGERLDVPLYVRADQQREGLPVSTNLSQMIELLRTLCRGSKQSFETLAA